ncbi:hypothetical protein SASPL_132695 [Salvia splendens]|uniref:Uncharacterized protein n=1 Tax=Salvia splendens TaxID=180675 RepID=A0A8X8X1M9_SALSN|nr:uncharacterized protein LOC121756903 [Salvia splendens]XP_042008262.1 uncharacterized protein LOC121756903 [Salvia splendens]KAG6405113.1 hypothetical protein SASPL_132695 [Salvia splendens]
MDKRQLDFNAPLMSARRYSSPSKSSELAKRKVVERPPPSRQQSLQPPKPKWECEEVTMTKPASVPFHWEHIPGRPKGEAESHSHTPEESTTPRLPPARISDATRRSSGEIPKLPPGRLSGHSRYCSGERTNDQNVYRSHAEAFSVTDHASLLERLNDSLNCKDESDSESGDEAYSDALDTLSLTESWSFNYSVSGISGYMSSGVKPSGTFSVDKQTRDFMMDRFLPAAKAVVVETPEYAVKKPVKKAVSREMKPSLKQYSSDALPYYTKYINSMESEDEDQESVAPPSKKSGKAWGIIPRFCVKNSLCLLNPLPALKSKPKSRPPSPSTREVKRFTRNAHSGPLDKNASQVVQKTKFHSGLLSRDLPRIDKFSNQYLNSGDAHRSAGVSPLGHQRSGNISPYRNETPKSPFREGAGFLGVPKEAEIFNAKLASSRKMFRALQDVSRNQINAAPADYPVEKTVYVDYVKKKELPSTNPSAKRAQVLDASKANGLSPRFIPSPKPEWRNEAPCEAEFMTKEEDDNGRRETDPPPRSPLPPPLPKSPSESWLWRTLPSIPLGNPFANSRRGSPLHSKKLQGQKASATNSKWETIVKTSNSRHDHIRFSEELVHRASYRRPMKT